MMTEGNFWVILLAGALTSVIHASLPNHWLPFVAAARFHKWTIAQLLRFTLLVAIAHAAITLALAVLMGLIGEGLVHFFHENAAKIAGTALLVLAGLFFFAPSLYGHTHIHHPECQHCHNSSEVVTLVGLFLSLALSPCEGLLPIFFAAAVKFGWLKALVVAILSSLLMVLLIVTIVWASYKGWEKFLPKMRERNERLLASALTGTVGILLLSGVWH